MVTAPDLKVEALNQTHDRARFTCGVESLDRYLKTQATQDVRRKASSVFVLVFQDAPEHILGYFTLSSFGVDRGEVPEALRKDLPRYPRAGATLIGRLAIDKSQQGQGLGSMLLFAAIRRAVANASIVGSSMIVVDALDESVAGFYERNGFVRLLDSMRLILPMRTAERI